MDVLVCVCACLSACVTCRLGENNYVHGYIRLVMCVFVFVTPNRCLLTFCCFCLLKFSHLMLWCNLLVHVVILIIVKSILILPYIYYI